MPKNDPEYERGFTDGFNAGTRFQAERTLPSDAEQLSELRKESLKGICVYCGEIQQYESMEQKSGDEGNQIRIAHIRQCPQRPELKLIAYCEELQQAASDLAEWLDMLVVALKANQKFEYNEWGQFIMGAESWADRLRAATTSSPAAQPDTCLDSLLQPRLRTTAKDEEPALVKCEVDDCNEHQQCFHYCVEHHKTICTPFTKEEAELIIGAIPLQALPSPAAGAIKSGPRKLPPIERKHILATSAPQRRRHEFMTQQQESNTANTHGSTSQTERARAAAMQCVAEIRELVGTANDRSPAGYIVFPFQTTVDLILKHFPAAVIEAGGDESRSCCASCKHPFCKDCNEVDECCKCGVEMPPRTITERLAQHEHIDIVPGVLGGVTPLISRTRISVHHLLTYLYHGNSIEYIAQTYNLSPEAIKDAIVFAQEVYDDAAAALRTPVEGESK